ncbi:short chain dehydrogenase domain-containing protein [Sarocladium implicatum]|nr:short chain dehydrogenase domain-containing protein [Sarocladium implicatum]
MTDSSLVYLVTGANRGIGRSVVGDLLTRPATTVIAAVRNVNDETATSLTSLPTAEESKLYVVGLDEKQPTISAATLPQRLSDLGITHIDIVIANGGASAAFRTVLEARADELVSDYEANVVAPMRLFQACWPFLQKSDAQDPRRKKFVYVSSTTGSIGVQLTMQHFPSTGYGTSKAAGNWLAAAIACEHKQDGLKTGIYHPGFVNTGLGQQCGEVLGMEPPTTTSEAAAAMLKHVDELNDDNAATFAHFRGTILPW